MASIWGQKSGKHSPFPRFATPTLQILSNMLFTAPPLSPPEQPERIVDHHEHHQILARYGSSPTAPRHQGTDEPPGRVMGALLLSASSLPIGKPLTRDMAHGP